MDPLCHRCVLHVAEEYLTGWQEWARQTLGIVMPTSRFLFANTVLVILALLFARLGWRRPVLSLIIPSATLVNAVFFHILPTVVQGRVSPGVYTATLLYLPFSTWALVGRGARRCAANGDCDCHGRRHLPDGRHRSGSEMAQRGKLIEVI
jgi:hypothetical protein